MLLDVVEVTRREERHELQNAENAGSEERNFVRGEEEDSEETSRFRERNPEDKKRQSFLRLAEHRQDRPAHRAADEHRHKGQRPDGEFAAAWRGPAAEEEVDDDDPGLERRPENPPDGELLFLAREYPSSCHSATLRRGWPRLRRGQRALLLHPSLPTRPNRKTYLM